MYVHWGMKTYPNITATSQVYSGQIGSVLYSQTGSSNYVCLPNDPEYDQHNQVEDDHRSPMYGAEYETAKSPVLTAFQDFDVPCSLCLGSGKTTLIIPARTSCYSGWTKEYQGYLMGAYHSYQGKEYICMVKHAEPIDSSGADLNGALIYNVE